MTTAQIAVVAVLALIVLAIGVAVGLAMRRRELRRRFGPEYDREVQRADRRVDAERELIGREKRHAQLDLKELDPNSRQQYASQWRAVQQKFVSDPRRAVIEGDDLVTRLIADRGYPTSDYEGQLAALSVEHARTLGTYRDAHETYLQAQRRTASTEDLRTALVRYRELFAELLGEDESAIVDSSGNDRTATRR